MSQQKIEKRKKRVIWISSLSAAAIITLILISVNAAGIMPNLPGGPAPSFGPEAAIVDNFESYAPGSTGGIAQIRGGGTITSTGGNPGRAFDATVDCEYVFVEQSPSSLIGITLGFDVYVVDSVPSGTVAIILRMPADRGGSSVLGLIFKDGGLQILIGAGGYNPGEVIASNFALNQWVSMKIHFLTDLTYEVWVNENRYAKAEGLGFGIALSGPIAAIGVGRFLYAGAVGGSVKFDNIRASWITPGELVGVVVPIGSTSNTQTFESYAVGDAIGQPHIKLGLFYQGYSTLSIEVLNNKALVSMYGGRFEYVFSPSPGYVGCEVGWEFYSGTFTPVFAVLGGDDYYWNALIYVFLQGGQVYVSNGPGNLGDPNVVPPNTIAIGGTGTGAFNTVRIKFIDQLHATVTYNGVLHDNGGAGFLLRSAPTSAGITSLLYDNADGTLSSNNRVIIDNIYTSWS